MGCELATCRCGGDSRTARLQSLIAMTARIFIVHPYPASISPMSEAFGRLWPEASKFDLLDDSLYTEMDEKGTISPVVVPRLRLLFDYAVGARADGIIFAGSTFGPAVDQARVGFTVPILKPDEAMAEAAVAAGRRIALLATAKRALPVIAAGIQAAAAQAAHPTTVSIHHVPGAHAEMAAGRRAEHDRLIAEVTAAMTDCDVLVLGQISMASAAAVIPPRPGRIVMTTPDSAVMKIRALLA